MIRDIMKISDILQRDTPLFKNDVLEVRIFQGEEANKCFQNVGMYAFSSIKKASAADCQSLAY